MGMCAEFLTWRLHPFFIKIRRESRGITSYFPFLKKVQLFKNINEKKSFKKSDLFLLIGLFPNLNMSIQQEVFLNAVLDVFQWVQKSQLERENCFNIMFILLFSKNFYSNENVLCFTFLDEFH